MSESNDLKKIAIIGASYLQLPLIEKAKSMGYQTHVFAWKCGDVGEDAADYFYPISIIEKEEILIECEKIGIDGICSIASDLASITVNYIANEMNLVGNSMKTTAVSTNKSIMKKCFETHGVPSPKAFFLKNGNNYKDIDVKYPLVVKPIDRSGSRGVSRVENYEELYRAVEFAKSQGFCDDILIEEFAEGQEYSVECISWCGKHTMLMATKKYTTKGPYFVEKAHMEPGIEDERILEKVKKEVFCALDALEVMNGASHSEVKIDDNGRILFIEIGARMGGDCIGSSLVKLSTGVDYVEQVINIAMGKEPCLDKDSSANHNVYQYVAIRYIFDNSDIEIYKKLEKEHPDAILESDIPQSVNGIVHDSSERFGYYIFAGEEGEVLPYLVDLE